MSLRRTIRKTHQSGAWVYAILEAIGGGKATVRLARGGMRLANLPCTTPNMRVGDKVILDYSAGVPPAVIPTIYYEPTVAPDLQLSRTARAEPSSQTTITADIGVKLTGTTLRTARRNWETIPFTDVIWDTGTFFRPQTPDHIYFLVPGVYLLRASIEVTASGYDAFQIFEMRFYNPDGLYSMPVGADLPVGGVNEDALYPGGPFVYCSIDTPKIFNIKGLGVFRKAETLQLQIRSVGDDPPVVDPMPLHIVYRPASPPPYPCMEVQFLGQIRQAL